MATIFDSILSKLRKKDSEIVTGEDVINNVPTCCGRLSLETGVSVSVADQTAKSTLYFVPHNGSQVSLYTGLEWKTYSFTERSLSLSDFSANTNYDIFIYDNAGTLTLEATAWTNNTTRATALALQNGIYVKSGSATKRYLGTIRTTSAGGQCEFSESKRYVWNMYNRVSVKGRTVNSNISWTYATASYRECNAGTGQTRFEFVLGLPDSTLNLGGNRTVTGNTVNMFLGAAVDSTTTAEYKTQFIAGGSMSETPYYINKGLFLVEGYHYVTEVEYGGAGATIYGGAYGYQTNVTLEL